jgi:hypothetical protein
VKGRVVSVLTLLAAAAGWFGLVLPARHERDRSRAEYARARQEREQLRAQIQHLAPREQRPLVAAADAAAVGRELRLTLLRAVEGLPVEEVQIAATAEPRRLAARGRLSAEGEMVALLRVTDRLVDTAAGLRVERVSLTASPGDPGAMRLEITVASPEAGS